MMTKSFNTNIQTTFQICKNILENSGYKITSENIQDGKIDAIKSMSFFSFGHKLEIWIESDVESKSKISVTSISNRFPFINWGNFDNENKFIDSIKLNDRLKKSKINLQIVV